MAAFETRSEQLAWGGRQGTYEHKSEACSGPMKFSVFLPPQAVAGAKVPALIYLAGLQDIPQDLYEAAKLDGAKSWQRFRYVTWPGLRNVNIFLLIITTIGALKLFTQVNILTKGGPNGATTTIIQYLFQQGYATQKVGYASAVAVFFFLAVTAIALLQRRFLRNEGEA